MPASGFIWSQDGIVVTAHHVVQREEGIVVGLSDGQSTPAEFVGRDPSTDLAVLRIQSGEQSAMPLVESGEVRVGNLVLALGRPGRTAQATLGIVSALGGAWRTPVGGQLDRYLQTDVLMYPGFSGGPLVDAAGWVLGMNTSALLRGVSLTVPTATIRRTVEALLAHGRMRRGFLGVALQPVRLPEGIAHDLGQETGLLILSVNTGGPADEAGLLLGDTLVAVGETPVRHMDDLMAILGGDVVDSRVTVHLVRGGRLQEVPVVVGDRP
jgi:S1-C subfamily serine protease